MNGNSDLMAIEVAKDLAAELNAREEKLAEAKGLLRNSITDQCNDDRQIRELAKPFGIDVEGDSYGVPGMVDVVEAMAKKLSELQAERDRLRAAVESIAESAGGELKHGDGSSTLRYIYQEAIEAIATTALSAKGVVE